MKTQGTFHGPCQASIFEVGASFLDFQHQCLATPGAQAFARRFTGSFWLEYFDIVLPPSVRDGTGTAADNNRIYHYNARFI